MTSYGCGFQRIFVWWGFVVYLKNYSVFDGISFFDAEGFVKHSPDTSDEFLLRSFDEAGISEGCDNGGDGWWIVEGRSEAMRLGLFRRGWLGEGEEEDGETD